MDFIPLLLVTVLFSLVDNGKTQSCEKSSYLPEGVSCKLDIFIRSEGESDSNLTVAMGSSFLIVNGRDYSRKKRGFNLAVFDQKTGAYVTGEAFDVKTSSAKGDDLRDFIQALPNKVIVLVAIQTSGNANNYLANAKAMLTSIGVNDTDFKDKESYAAVLCKGLDDNCVIKQAKNTAGNGPSFVALTISPPNSFIPDESLRSPFFDVALETSGGKCTKASSNAGTCAKMLDGSTATEWVTNSEGIGAWFLLEFPVTKINKIRIFQRTDSTAQIKDVRLDFSDCTTVHVALTKSKNNFEEFWFSPRVVYWVKFTVTSTHTATNPVGYKSIQILFDEYSTDSICDQATVSSGGSSQAYPLFTTSMSLRLKSQDAVIILSTTSSISGPRYEIVFDQASSNTSFLRRSHDGSSITTVATSAIRPRYVSATTFTHVWMDWTPGRVVLGMGERIIIYYRDDSPLTVKNLFIKSPTGNGVFDICGRPDYRFEDADHYWPFDKIILNDLKSVKKGILHGPEVVTSVTGNVYGFNKLAVNFDGVNNYGDLGDFKDECISDPTLCTNGLTVLIRFGRSGSGERFILSTNGENGRGFAISHHDPTGTVTVELRDSTRRWSVSVSVPSSGQQMLGFSWSKLEGLHVVVGSSGFTQIQDVVGVPQGSTSDESTHLFVGKPSKENSKYFKGSIDSIAIYNDLRSMAWMLNILKANGISGMATSCNTHDLIAASKFYFPALDQTTMSPNKCQEECNKANSHKAVIDNGGICKCINDTVTMNSVASDLCDIPCPGNKQLNCGGLNGNMLVLGAVASPASLSCALPSQQETLTKFDVQITASKPFYEPSLYVIDSGDGMSTASYSSSFPYMFTNIQNYTSTPEVKFKNNETGDYVTVPCNNGVTSYMVTKDLAISCPKCGSVNADIDCNITFTQSWDDTLSMDLDGSVTNLPLPGSVIQTIGGSCTTRSSSNAEKGLHILPFPVNFEGYVVALDIDVVKEGYLDIKCFKVTCDQSSRYCPTQNACVARSAACQNTGTICKSKTLDMGTGYCTSNGCKDMLPAQVPSNLNYKPQFSLVIWTNSGHRRLITMNSTVDTSMCDFFAVEIPETSPATLSFSKCENCSLFYTKVKVNAINSTGGGVFPGYQSPTVPNGPAVTSEVPNVKLRILQKGRNTLRLKYPSDGKKSITIRSTMTGMTSSVEVYSQYILSNLSISTTPEAHAVNQLSNVSLSPHLTTNASYQWMFGDINKTTYEPWLMYSCPKPGMNSLTMFGSNCMSLSYVICEILCQEQIDGLEFVPNGLETTAENDMASINWLLRNGSHVNITVDCGDGSELKYLTNAKVWGAVLVASLNKTYTTKGLYQVNITACNLLGCKSIVGNITIQSKVANLTITAPECTATNKTVNFTSAISRGCDVQYIWTTDGITNSTGAVPWFIHTYSQAGLKNISLAAQNNVSMSMTSCKGVVIKDAIEGVEVGPVEDSGIPQATLIPFKVNGGSDIKVSISFGDGAFDEKNETFSAEGDLIYNGSFVHNYTKGGDYIANLTFCNCVGCNSTTVNVHIEILIAGPIMVVGRKKPPTIHVDACSSPLYVLVKEVVFMSADISNGTNVKYTWDYGDGHNSSEYVDGEFHEAGAHTNHSYENSGNYTISVRLENKNGFKVFTCAIVAQDPILELEMSSNSPQGIPGGEISITTKTKGVRPSDPIHCVCSFGDGVGTGSLAMSYGTPQSVAINHHYPHHGLFNASCNCSNAVSFAVQSVTVEMQDKIYEPILVAYGMAPQAKRAWVVGPGYNGPGKTGQIFPLENDITFLSQSFNGTNRTCRYCFDCGSDEEVIKNTSCGNTTHKFTTAGNKIIKLNISNDVSLQIASINLITEETISCNEIPDIGTKTNNTPHIFQASPTKHGPNWCCLFKYGATTNGDFYVPPSSNCENPKVEGVSSFIQKEVKGNAFIGNHTFPAVGTYENALFCWNRVSECKLAFTAVVVPQPCKMPIVTIPDLHCNKSNPKQTMRSARSVIRSKNEVNCEASLVPAYKWEYYKIDSKTNTETKINLTERGLSWKHQNIELPPRALELGLYKACFTLNMTEVTGVFGTKCCYQNVNPSPIIADISGGTTVVVGWNKTRVLDGLQSKDPDTEYTVGQDSNLTCYFFCKAQNENYTLPETIDINNIPEVPPRRVITPNNTDNVTHLGGCSGDGPGLIESDGCSAKIFTGHMLENVTYILRLVIRHKDGRTAHTQQMWDIKPGDPPAMEIACLGNCKGKLNPSESTKLQCKCKDCSSLAKVFYEWSMCEIKPGDSECKLLSEDRFLSSIRTLIDNPNIVIKANILEGDYKYQFKCKGWRGKKTAGNNGESIIEKHVNLAPRNGFCKVSPLSGIALNTSYTIECQNWEDIDVPLTYTFGTVDDCTEIKSPRLLASDRMENKYKAESLPPGKKENNYTRYITVHVADAFKAWNISAVCIPVQVKEKILSPASLEKMLDTDVEKLAAGGNSNEVNQVVTGIADNLNSQSNGEQKNQRTELRSKLVITITKIDFSVATVDELKQTAASLHTAIDKKDEVSPEASLAAVKTLGSMTNSIAEKASAGAEPTAIMGALTTVMVGVEKSIAIVAHSVPEVEAPTGTTEQKATEKKVTEPPPMTEEQKSQNRQLAKSLEKTMNTVAKLVLHNMLPDEKPISLETEKIVMQMARYLVDNFANTTTYMKNGLSYESPSDFGITGDGGDQTLDVQAFNNKDNMYNFGSNAQLTKGSTVTSLDYSNTTSGKEYVIRDLKKLMKLCFPRLSNSIKPEVIEMSKFGWYSHKVTLQNNDTALHIIVRPDNCNYGFRVYIRRNQFPDEDHSDFNYTLPHDNRWDLTTNCSKDSNDSKAFEIFVSADDFNHTAAGVYYVSIVPQTRNATIIGDIFPANYTLIIYQSMCMYWNKTSEAWKTDGCKVLPETTPKLTCCGCNHLTAFSSACIVPPNEIDWNKIANPSFEDVYVVMSTVLVVYGIYFICLVFARKADKRDAEKTGVCPLPDNDPRDNYCYEIHVHTGFMRGAGTSAEVSVVMNGSVGDSDPRVLEDSVRKTFRTGGVDAFLMTAPQSLGVLRNIRIWHNNGGAYPSWNLLRIMIQDLQTSQRWWFVCDEWLAVDEGDGKIERILYPATSNDLTKFNVLFATEIRKNLTDGHLWFSVVTRPARSTFTRVQRLTCCLSILLTSMLANMMFYENDAEGPKGSIQVAGFNFSLRQVSIGIISSLVVFPANLVVVQLFRKARAKEVTTDINKYDEITPEEEDIEKGAELEEKPKVAEKKEGLPHWCVYIAYSCAFISCVVSTVFVMLYGITFGEEKSAKWLMSMTISLIQDVLISQPIKIFILASMFALLIKDPNKAESDPITDANKLSTDEEWLHKNVKDLNEDEKKDFKKLIMDRPPDEAKLEIARQLRMKERQMKSIIRELVWYMIFLMVVLTISYGNRDPDTYRITKYMNDLFVKSTYNGTKKFQQVRKIDEYWKWMNETVIPSVYKDQWYNAGEDYPLGFLADTPTDFLLAVVRLRQLRIKKNSCTFLPVFKHVIDECNDFYNTDDEDRGAYLTRWESPPDVNTTLRPPGASKTAWEYQTGSELKTFPYWGYKATYNAGGYAKELPSNLERNIDKAFDIVSELSSLDWIDRYTRAVFTELAIYNANTNFFCVITLLYEQLPTGSLFNYPSILTLKLYRYVDGDMYFVMACEITYMLFTIYFIFREMKKVKKDGIDAIKNVWSVTEIFITILSLSLVVLYFMRIKFTSDAVGQMRSDSSHFVSFNYTAFLDEWINALMGTIVFFSFLKIIRLLRFNRRMSLLAQTLKVCIPRITAFLAIYGTSFFAFSIFACLVFGQDMENFGTISRSATTLMDTILGKFQLKAMTNANRIIGPLFFYFYTVSMVFILINMFLSIINDSFSEVKSDVNKQSNDYEIVDFMVHRLKENIGKTMGNAIVPIYKEPKTKLEKDFDSIVENADNIMHHMRNLTFENMRHTRWFDANAAKEKKKKMFEILMEVDWDYFEDELGDSIPVFEDFLGKYDEKRLQSVHESYVYKKLRDQENDSKISSVLDSDTVDDSSDSDDSNDSDAPSNVSGGNSDQSDTEDIKLEIPGDGTRRSSQGSFSPGNSIRGMYGTPSSPRPTSSASSKPMSSGSNRKPRAQTPKAPIPTITVARDDEMDKVLADVDRERCATDAELNSFLPEIRSVDDNNVPKYESDPEQVAKKSKKKKKAKIQKTKDQDDSFSIASKPAWGEDDTIARKSPAGYSENDRLIPVGDDIKIEGRDNNAFEGDETPKIKDKKKKKKKKKKQSDA